MFENSSFADFLPPDNISISPENFELFFRTLYERQMIWKRRFMDQLPRPWTKDKILEANKFTNVYRDLDRSSQWQIQNILLDDSLSLKDLIWKLMVYRFFNCPETFKKGLEFWDNGIPSFDEYNPEEFLRFIKSVRASGQNPFTSAYLIASVGSRDTFYACTVLKALHNKLDTLIHGACTASRPEMIVDYIKNNLPGAGSFVAHEFFVDFTYIRRYTKRDDFMKFTQNDFVNVGPGSSTGLRLIYPSLNTLKKQKQGIYDLRDAAETELQKISAEMGEPFPFVEFDKDAKKYYISDKCNITLHQIEMWLCEYQKYWKMMWSTGKQRSKFVPITKKSDLVK